MEKTQARVELENYLTALEELEGQREAGQLDRLHYMMKRTHQQEQLIERSWTAWRAIDAALGHLKPLPVGNRDVVIRLAALKDADFEAFRVWKRRFFRANLGPIAHRFLDLYEAVRVVDVPDMNPP